MIKLFASDLDGTLLNGLHEADRTIRGAIQEAIAQGAHVVPATGRSLLPAGEHGFTAVSYTHLLDIGDHRAYVQRYCVDLRPSGRFEAGVMRHRTWVHK